jgi:hypothetical protein
VDLLRFSRVGGSPIDPGLLYVHWRFSSSSGRGIAPIPQNPVDHHRAVEKEHPEHEERLGTRSICKARLETENICFAELTERRRAGSGNTWTFAIRVSAFLAGGSTAALVAAIVFRLCPLGWTDRDGFSNA